jgi:hypothetical protein
LVKYQPPHAVRRCIDQIAHSFRLHEIELAVQNRAASELTSMSLARACSE